MLSSHTVCLLCRLLIIFLSTSSANTWAEEFKVAALQSGTVNWEMDVLKHHQLDKKYGFNLKLIPVASSNAVNIHLQSGNVDAVVGDWIWVSRQRDDGKLFTSFPYSLAAGELIVNPDSNIHTITQLQGKKVGVAGGPVNKNWLIFRAYTAELTGKDFDKLLQTRFAAPPLLNRLFLNGEFHAVLNFWHYAAKLKTYGMTKLISVKDMLVELGISESLPLLVWIFHEKLLETKPGLVEKFFKASYEAKAILKQSDTEWDRIQGLINETSSDELKNVKEYYRESIPVAFTEEEINSAKNLFKLLKVHGGKSLVGDSKTLSAGTFYQNVTVF